MRLSRSLTAWNPHALSSPSCMWKVSSSGVMLMQNFGTSIVPTSTACTDTTGKWNMLSLACLSCWMIKDRDGTLSGRVQFQPVVEQSSV